MTARRILVTGATGGLGIAILAELTARGHSVVATGRSAAMKEQVEATGAEYRCVDLVAAETDFGRLAQGCDSVIHAAALSASWGPRAAFEQANVAMTARLLDACRAQGVRRFVFASSPSIFASYADRLAISEHCAPAAMPLNHYARTKLAAERLVLANRDIAASAIRPRALVGPGDRVILPRLAASARRNRMPLPAGGSALVELTDLRDAARAICEAEERALTIAGKAINISGGQPETVRTIATQLAHALEESPKLVALPMSVARPLARMAETWAVLTRTKSEPVLTRYTLATLGHSQTFDLEPARRLLGYEPRHNALQTLLAEARRMAA